MSLLNELRMAGVDVKESSADENEIRLCCPFCVEMGESPDFKYRLGINLRSGLGHCFNCGWSSRKAFFELVRKIGLKDGVLTAVLNTPFTKQTRERDETVTLPEGYVKLSELERDDPLYESAIQYVRKRGITWRQIREKEIGATIDDDDMYRYRIIFPMWDQEGNLAGFVGRTWIEGNPVRFLNKRGTKIIYNARPDLYPKKIIIVSEGITKALAIERATRYKLCSGAVLGNSITDTHANQLKAFKEVVLFPDPDRPGMRGFLGIAANIASVVEKVSLAWPWPKKQADDLTSEEIRAALRNRRPYSMLLDWKIRLEMRTR